MTRLFACVGCSVVVGLLALPAVVSAQTMPSMLVDRTPTYTVELTIGPPEQMLSPGDAMHAQMGEVMVTGGPMQSMGGSGSMAGGSMGSSMGEMGSGSSMSMNPDRDQGMGVNHHLEIHIMRNDSGAVVNDVTPVIRITDKSTGESRDLSQVMGMYAVQTGPSDFHYGQNVWLPDGTYTVTAMIGPDTAVFRDVEVMGGGMQMGGSGSGSMDMSMGH
jgi:hypothetical protein